jgi:hypothetical protein
LHDLVNNTVIRHRGLSRLWGPLSKVVEDPQLKKAAVQMHKKLQTFNQLMCIAVAQSKKGLNDKEADIIEQKVKRFRKEIMPAKDYHDLDKYWDKLFADPITVYIKRSAQH